MQYVELAYTAYVQYYIYSIILVFITLFSGIWAIGAQYEKRMQLYNTVQQRRIIPLLHGKLVR